MPFTETILVIGESSHPRLPGEHPRPPQTHPGRPRSVLYAIRTSSMCGRARIRTLARPLDAGIAHTRYAVIVTATCNTPRTTNVHSAAPNDACTCIPDVGKHPLLHHARQRRGHPRVATSECLLCPCTPPRGPCPLEGHAKRLAREFSVLFVGMSGIDRGEGGFLRDTFHQRGIVECCRV